MGICLGNNLQVTEHDEDENGNDRRDSEVTYIHTSDASSPRALRLFGEYSNPSVKPGTFVICPGILTMGPLRRFISKVFAMVCALLYQLLLSLHGATITPA